jgi:hypothetical protein
MLTATQSYSPKVFGNLPNARAALRAGNESETHRQLDGNKGLIAFSKTRVWRSEA